MKRWFYILLGSVGLMLVAWMAIMEFLAPPMSVTNRTATAVVEAAIAVVGLVLSVVGFVQAKSIGEFDIASIRKASKRADYAVQGSEIEFACPSCAKTYRASPLLAGRPFMCRGCSAGFTVPDGPSDVKGLPSPASLV